MRMTCGRCADAQMMSRSNFNPAHCVSENIACADDVWMTCYCINPPGICVKITQISLNI